MSEGREGRMRREWEEEIHKIPETGEGCVLE